MRLKKITDIQVRFADTDKMGHVNNARYFEYLEYARVCMYGRYKELDLIKMRADQKEAFIIAHLDCDYKAPAFVGDTLEVWAHVSRIGRASFDLHYEIRSRRRRGEVPDEGKPKLIATANSVQVMFDYKKNRVIPIPPSLRKKLARQ